MPAQQRCIDRRHSQSDRCEPGSRASPPPVSKGLRPRPMPAPIISRATQEPMAIWPQLRFQLRPTTLAIRIVRKPSGSTQRPAVSPSPIPIASLGHDIEYFWTDNTLSAVGSWDYSVLAELSDGSVVPSLPLTFTPQIFAAANVSVTKVDSYTALVEFVDGPLAADNYRLYGTGIATGVPATRARGLNGRRNPVWRVWVSNLATGNYNWVLRAEFKPAIRSTGVPVGFTLP
jgi:hypothetical protein